MEPADLLGALVRGALTGKSNKKGVNAVRFLTGGGRGGAVGAGAMLTAAGLAWGLLETLQNSQAAQSGGNQWGGGPSPGPMPGSPVPTPPSTPQMTGGPVVPPPLPGRAPTQATAVPADIPPAVLRAVRLTIAAARADGTLGGPEREAILAQARAVGAETVVAQELERVTPLVEIVSGVADAQEKEGLYVLAFSIVRADESVTGSERIFLAQLAALLSIDPATVARLEQSTAEQIDAHGTSN
ncbi:MAG: DUF533 domain-containing protein [Vicinamibacterales bacterium]